MCMEWEGMVMLILILQLPPGTARLQKIQVKSIYLAILMIDISHETVYLVINLCIVELWPYCFNISYSNYL